MKTQFHKHFASLKSRWLGSLAVLLMTAALPLPAAQDTFERVKPHCNISTASHVNNDSGGFDFRARLQVFFDGEANGFLEFAFADGTVWTYTARAGLVDQSEDPKRPKLMILLDYPATQDSAGNGGREFLVATVQQDAIEKGCDLWDIIGTQVVVGSAGNELCPRRLSFEAPDGIAFVPGEGGPARDPFQPELRLKYPIQRVQIEGGAESIWLDVGFRASVVADQHHRARGMVQFTTRDGRSLQLEALLGLPIPNPVPAISLRPAVVLFIIADAPLETRNLVFATVTPDARDAGLDQWDLVGTRLPGGSSSSCHLRFDAIGDFTSVQLDSRR